MVTQTNQNDDAAFVDAYERRLAGGTPSDVPAQWRDEIEQMARMHARLAALPLPEVSPAVRSVVLTAAAQVAAEASQPKSVFARLFEFLLKPGPILVAASAAALLIAVNVRNDKPAGEPVADVGAVAVLDRAETPAAAPAAPAAAPAPAPAAAVAEAKPAPAAGPVGAAAAPAEPAAAEPAVAADQPGSAPIAARPASVAPDSSEKAQVAGDRPADKAKGKAAYEEQQFAQPPPPKAQLAQNAAPNAAQNAAQNAKNEPAAEAPQQAMGMVAQRNNAGKDLDDSAARKEQKAEADVAKKADEIARAAYQGNRNAAPRSAPAAPPAPAAANAASAEAEAPQADANYGKRDNAGQEQVAKLRAEAEKTADMAKRLPLLKAVYAAAVKAGDTKAAQWAKAQIAAAESERLAPAKVNRAKSAEPVQKGKAGSAPTME